MMDKAIIQFRDLVKSLSSQKLYEANEATTRKRVIDVMLEKVLGWNMIKDIEYEERVSEDGETTYADYILRTATTGIVVEAKKIGISFELPSNKRTCLLGGAIAKSLAGEATQQARDYARKKSVPFAVATNGTTWIIFPAVRTDGVSFEQTQAHIFKDLADVESRFVSFWNLLSRQRVIEGGLEETLFGQDAKHIDRRLISVFREPGFRIGRNAVYEHIEPAVSMALTDESILEDVEGLQFCYVRTSERLKFDARLKTHIADIKPNLERTVIRPRRTKQKNEYLEEVIGSTEVKRQPRFIMVLGPVGAGKTTFLQYTKLISAAKIIDGKIPWLYVDFKEATVQDNPRQYIFNSLLTSIENDEEFRLGSWEESVSKAYAPIIENLKKGPLALLAESDPVEFKKELSKKIYEDSKAVVPYVKTILSHVSSERPSFLVVDNVDQIPSTEYQQQVFLETQSAARIMGLNAIICLRDTTYIDHIKSPVFDAFQVDTLYIDPPQVAPVLSRRFAYAEKFLHNHKATIVSETGKSFIVDDLGCFFKILTSSLLDEETGYLIEVLSHNDIRHGLTLVRNFLASGHTSADNALFLCATGGDYRFKAHEFFKGAVFGQRQYYREEESVLANVFDSHAGAKATQLLRLFLISKLKKLGASEGFAGLLMRDIEHDLYQIGISREVVYDVVSSLIKFGMIRTSSGHELSDSSSILTTRLGAYAAQELSARFHYFEPCMIDANISDDETWELLQEMTKVVESERGIERIKARVERARIFLEYLKQLENEWNLSCKRFSLDSSWEEEIIHTMLVPALEIEFERVVGSARKQKLNKTLH